MFLRLCFAHVSADMQSTGIERTLAVHTRRRTPWHVLRACVPTVMQRTGLKRTSPFTSRPRTSLALFAALVLLRTELATIMAKSSAASVCESTASSSMATPRKAKSAGTLEQQSSSMMDSLLEESITELVAMLRADPAKVLPALALARGEALVPKKRDDEPEIAEEDKPFNVAYTRLGRVPKEFARSVMVQQAPDKCAHEDFIKAEKFQEGSTRNAFFFAHNISPKTGWPKFCLRKDVFRATFDKMHRENNSPLNDILFLKSGRDVQINWNLWGAYKLTSQDGLDYMSHVYHTGTKISTELPDTFKIKSADDYTIVRNWDHEGAQLKWGKIRRAFPTCSPIRFAPSWRSSLT